MGTVEGTGGTMPACGHQEKAAAQTQAAPLDFTPTELWFGEHAPYQEGGKKIDLGIGKNFDVHHQEI